MTKALRSQCLVTVCRDCCCGSATKHADVDHDGQLRALRDGLRGVAEVRVSACLDVCDQSNVVVVNPSPQARRSGGRATWLGLVLDDGAVADVAAWVRAGGPGRSDLPPGLDLHVMRRPRGARAAR